MFTSYSSSSSSASQESMTTNQDDPTFPLLDLPADLRFRILSFLSRKMDLRGLAQVCKLLNEDVEPLIWRHVALQHYDYFESMASFTLALERNPSSSRHVRTLTMRLSYESADGGDGNHSNPVFPPLSKYRFQNLQKLHLESDDFRTRPHPSKYPTNARNVNKGISLIQRRIFTELRLASAFDKYNLVRNGSISAYISFRVTFDVRQLVNTCRQTCSSSNISDNFSAVELTAFCRPPYPLCELRIPLKAFRLIRAVNWSVSQIRDSLDVSVTSGLQELQVFGHEIKPFQPSHGIEDFSKLLCLRKLVLDALAPCTLSGLPKLEVLELRMSLCVSANFEGTRYWTNLPSNPQFWDSCHILRQIVEDIEESQCHQNDGPRPLKSFPSLKTLILATEFECIPFPTDQIKTIKSFGIDVVCDDYDCFTDFR